ncbi:MAG: hypothetical protein AAGK14_08775 [Verrucomicrobiota bacterium]
MSTSYRDLPDDEPQTAEEEELLPTASETATAPTPAKGKPAEEYNAKVQQVQSQLLELQRQQEEMEKQQRELQEIGRKQREFDEGRDDAVERLTRGLVVLERQQIEVDREADQIRSILQQFQEQLDSIKSIQPENWSSDELHEELTRSLAVIDKANATHLQARTRLAVLQEDHQRHEEDEYTEAEDGSAAGNNMSDMMRAGLAFSLPFMLFLLILAFLLLGGLFYLGTQPAP